MRPLKINREEVGGGNLIGKISLVPAAEELWNAWEIHCLILVSLFLQVFLFLFAGMRRRSSSRVLSAVLWLAYLSADSVAVFVLGHLAVRAGGEPVVSFWAPFVLVHLGGQDSISAFSRQDNDLWQRHLLNLATQAAVAGYVVAKASWPDPRLTAAMAIMFVSGFFKYAERTLCLYLASPAKLMSEALNDLSSILRIIQERIEGKVWPSVREANTLVAAFDKILGDMSLPEDSGTTIVSVDAPSNMLDYMVAAANDLPRILEKVIQCKKHNYFRVYDYAGRCLKNSYQKLYTKHNLRICLYAPSGRLICKITNCQHSSLLKNVVETMFTTIFVFLVTLYNVFPFLPALIALVLFMAADKGGQLHTSSRSSADVTVSYILLVGALILEVSSSAMIIFSIFKPKLAAKNIILPEWTRSKQWSEKLAQYNMIKAVQADHHTKASCISNCLVAKCAGLLCSLTHKTITVDLGQTPIKEFILDNLLDYGLRKEWSCSSSRGHLVLQRWINGSYQHPGSALPKSTSGSVDFPTSVLIWHIATDICYYGEIESGGGGAATTTSSSSSSTSSSDQLKDQKEMSRQLSNYVMHLVFKRGVMLTSKSQLVHDKVCADLGGDEKDAIVKLFETNIEEKKKQATDIDEEQAGLNSTEAKVHIHSASPATTTPSSKHAQKLELLRRAEAALHHPVMSDAREVAKVLGAIGGEANRWGLIAGVWAEMLYYIAPRAGAAFHYESLSTGGEFITHLLFIMRLLGPFMPTPDGASSSSSSSAP